MVCFISSTSNHSSSDGSSSVILPTYLTFGLSTLLGGLVSLISYSLLIIVTLVYGNVTSLPVCWNPAAACSLADLRLKTYSAALSTVLGLSSLVVGSIATL